MLFRVSTNFKYRGRVLWRADFVEIAEADVDKDFKIKWQCGFVYPVRYPEKIVGTIVKITKDKIEEINKTIMLNIVKKEQEIKNEPKGDKRKWINGK